MENTKCSLGWRWAAVGLYAALLFYLSSLHHPTVPHFRFSDKVMHLGFYAGFGAVVAWACDPVRRGWTSLRIIMTAGLGALLYGSTDEIHQLFVSERTADVIDLLFDVLGGVLGGGLYSAITYGHRSRRKGKAEGRSQKVASL